MAVLEELIVWKVAVAFSEAVMELDRMNGRRLPRKLRDQLVDAAASVPSNIAEGYYRNRPRQFVQFIDYARASLGEAEARLKIAVALRAFTQQEIDPILQLAKRFSVASWRLRAHLERQSSGKP
jgi:four helix bundle protein